MLARICPSVLTFVALSVATLLGGCAAPGPAVGPNPGKGAAAPPAAGPSMAPSQDGSDRVAIRHEVPAELSPGEAFDVRVTATAREELLGLVVQEDIGALELVEGELSQGFDGLSAGQTVRYTYTVRCPEVGGTAHIQTTLTIPTPRNPLNRVRGGSTRVPCGRPEGNDEASTERFTARRDVPSSVAAGASFEVTVRVEARQDLGLVTVEETSLGRLRLAQGGKRGTTLELAAGEAFEHTYRVACPSTGGSTAIRGEVMAGEATVTLTSPVECGPAEGGEPVRFRGALTDVSGSPPELTVEVSEVLSGQLPNTKTAKVTWQRDAACESSPAPVPSTLIAEARVGIGTPVDVEVRGLARNGEVTVSCDPHRVKVSSAGSGSGASPATVAEFDTDGSCVIERDEFFDAFDQWLDHGVEDKVFFAVVDAWTNEADVCTDASARTVDAKGTVVFKALEGGFHGLVAEDGHRFLPINWAEFAAFKEDGREVAFRAEVRADVGTVFQWGTPVRLLSVEGRNN